MLKKVNLTVSVVRQSLNRQLLRDFCGTEEEDDVDFDDEMLDGLFPEGEEEQPGADGPETMEVFSEGRLHTEECRFSLTYEESEITGMEGTTSQISFDPCNPGLVTMLRTGNFATALVFERKKRHVCLYRTPFMTLEVCVYTRKIENRLAEEAGTLDIDYIIEIRGAEAEHCTLSMKLQK